MSCPKCGLQTLPDQKFCRSCGASLQMTTQRLVKPATISDPELRPAIGFADGKQRAQALALWGFIIMFIGAAIGVIGKKLVHDDIVTVVGILVSLAGMFITVYPYLAPSRRRHDSGPPSPPEVLAQSPSTKYLSPEGNIEYVSSVTERTTDLLEAPVPRTPRPKADEDPQA
jgi:zinc-ribbon domain